MNNFLGFQNNNSKTGHFQDLDHIDGVAISTISAGLYNFKRDDLVLFYFRDGGYHASVYTQSKIISENIKWNVKIRSKKVKGVLINTRNANCFTGNEGFKNIRTIANLLAEKLSTKQINDEEKPVKIRSDELLFASTGTIGEKFPIEKIKSNINKLSENIKYNQNKYVWIKAAMGIITTDLKPKLAMEECKIGSTEIKIYGVAKGSGMIHPNLATTLGFIFTDANLSSSTLKKILSKSIQNTFNAITCDSDTSTNDMVSIFATAKAKNVEIKNPNDRKLNDFQKKLTSLLLNLAKSVVADGEGATKFITVNVKNCKSEDNAKKIAFSIANSPLVKTAINGEDPNWGRIIMAIGKSNVNININKMSLSIGDLKIIENGQLNNKYNEDYAKEYMQNEKIDINLNLNLGNKNFTAYTMDFSKNYININADYRS